MFWYNGQLIEGDRLEIGIDDPSLLYGANTFTTLRVYQQSLDHPLTHWQSHCDRLINSLNTFGWQQPNWKRLRQEAEYLLPHYPILRIVIFSDGKEWIRGRDLADNIQTQQQEGVTGWLADNALYQRSLANYKTGNYLSAWLALQKAKEMGAKEAILIDKSGNWLETSTGNLWGWHNGVWYTPNLDNRILPGIVRSHLLNWLNANKIKVEENTWTPGFIQQLEVIAYSNSGVELLPFSKIIGLTKNFNHGASHRVLNGLLRYFQQN